MLGSLFLCFTDVIELCQRAAYVSGMQCHLEYLLQLSLTAVIGHVLLEVSAACFCFPVWVKRTLHLNLQAKQCKQASIQPQPPGQKPKGLCEELLCGRTGFRVPGSILFCPILNPLLAPPACFRGCFLLTSML